MDAKTSIPDFIHISDGKMHDVNVLDMITILPYSYYVMDKGYLDFSRLYRIHTAQAYFITRAKKNFDFKRMYSVQVDKTTGIRCDQSIKLCGFLYFPELSYKNEKDKVL